MNNITDIRIHIALNGVVLTIDTHSAAYEYVYKDIPTALRKVKQNIASINAQENNE
jgi:hypothetical protein